MLFLAAAVVNVVLQHRFFARLRREHPTLWDDLRPFESWPTEHTEYAGAQMYLIAGRYANLDDASLVRRARRARVAFFLCAVVLVMWLSIVIGRHAPPSLSCITGQTYAGSAH